MHLRRNFRQASSHTPVRQQPRGLSKDLDPSHGRRKRTNNPQITYVTVPCKRCYSTLTLSSSPKPLFGTPRFSTSDLWIAHFASHCYQRTLLVSGGLQGLPVKLRTQVVQHMFGRLRYQGLEKHYATRSPSHSSTFKLARSHVGPIPLTWIAGEAG